MRFLMIFVFSGIAIGSSAQFYAATDQSPHVKMLTVADGLTSNIITDLLQDNRGFLWISTISGLNRYDGSQIVQYYKSEKKESLPANWISRIFLLDSLHLLIGTPQGLSVMDIEAETFSRVNINLNSDNLYFDNLILNIERDPEGNFWVSTPTIICQLDAALKVKKTFRTQLNPVSKRKINSRKIFALPGGDVLFFMEYGIFIYKKGEKELREIQASDEYGFLTTTEFFSATLFKNRFLIYKSPEAWEIYNVVSKERMQFDLPGDKSNLPELNNVLGTGKDWVMIRSGETQIYTLLFDQRNKVFLQKAIPNNTIIENKAKVIEDNDGNFWAFQLNTGLMKIGRNKQMFQNISFYNNLSSGSPTPLFERFFPFQGGLLISATNGGLYQFKPALPGIDRLRLQSRDILGKNIWSVGSLSEDTVWIGTQKGLIWYHNKNHTSGRLKQKHPEGLDNSAITVQFEDSKGIRWLGVGLGKGLIRYYAQTGKFEQDTAIREYPYRYPLAIAEDAQQNLWFVSDPTANLVKWVRKTNKYEVKKTLGELGDLYSCSGNILLDNSTGNLWFDISSLGLACYNIFSSQTEIFGLEHGFCGGVISGIALDSKGMIWLSTFNGISSFDPVRRRFINYDKRDGLAASEYNSLYYDKNADLMYAGASGALTKFSPDDFRIDTFSLPLFFTRVMVNNVRVNIPADRPIILEPYQNNLIVSFTGVNLSNGTFNSYQYKLSPGTEEWIDIGSQKQINFAGLQPGSYTLQVRGARKNGMYFESAQSLFFQIRRPFVNTVWFYLILFSVAAIIIYLWYRYRIIQLKRMESMRLHISQDLHDEIGSRVTNIRLMSDIAQKTNNTDPKWLQNIKEESMAVAQRMREIVWNIRPGNDKMETALPQIMQYISNTLEAQNIEVTAQMDQVDNKFRLDMDQRHNLLLIVKEAVHNIIKHAGASEVNVRVTCYNKRHIIELTDNGKGFGNTEVGGNGIEGMKLRALEQNWKLKIFSGLGKGTSIRIEI